MPARRRSPLAGVSSALVLLLGAGPGHTADGGDAGPSAEGLSPPAHAIVLVDVDESSIGEQLLSDFLEGHHAVRHRVVTVNADYLRTHTREAPPADALVIRLFQDIEVVIEISAKQEHYSGPDAGFASFGGAVRGDPHGSVTMVIHPSGRVTATLLTKDGLFGIQYTDRDPYHIVYEVDPELPIVR